MQRKNFLQTVCVAFLIVIPAVLVTLIKPFSETKPDNNRIVDFVLTSPNSLYKVEVKGLNSSSWHPLGSFYGTDNVSSADVTADVYSQGNLVAKEELLQSKDGFDGGSFTGEHPERIWITNSILRLGLDEKDNPRKDEIVITNESSSNVSYLRLYAGADKFLLFALPAKTTIKLPANVPRLQRLVSIENGYWDNKNQIANYAISAPSDYPNNAQYQVVIKDKGVEIKSCMFEVSYFDVVNKEYKWFVVPKSECSN